MKCLVNPLLYSWNIIPWYATAYYLRSKLRSATTGQWRQLQENMPILTVPSRLLFVLILSIS
ncbi:hypothetical protein ES703_109750 [subsurface metagenome]